MLKSLALAVLFLAVTTLHAAHVNNQAKVNGGDSGAHEAQSEARGTDQSPLVVNTHTIQSDKESAEDAAKVAEQKHFDTWTVGLTSAIAVIAFFQLGGILLQVWVYLKQTSLMKETLGAIETQARHMETQNSTLKDSVRVAELSAIAAKAQIEMMKQQKRAHLSVKEPEPFLALDLSWMDFNFGKVEIENFGESHAFNVKVRTKAEITTSETPPEFAELNDTTIPGVIRAGESPTPINVWYLTDWEERKVDLAKPNLFIHMRGIVEYTDVFTDKHSTGFRYSMEINKITLSDASGEVGKITSTFGWKRTSRGPFDNRAT